MQIKSILLTSDDGYNSIGVRLLVALLKDKYDLAISATKEQQSGVGGKINISGGEWGETMIDGVSCFWVDGSPCDAIESSVNYYKKKFDLVISGVNSGTNTGELINSSGTFSAAFRAIDLKLTQRAMALSWRCPKELWLMQPDAKRDLTKYIVSPGETISKVLDLALKNNMWGSNLLNINFPEHNCQKIKITKPIDDGTIYFDSVSVDKKTKRFFYPNEETGGKENDLTKDMDAVANGYVSITPCNTTFLNKEVYQKIKDLEFEV
jgi:5'-nucleotidase